MQAGWSTSSDDEIPSAPAPPRPIRDWSSDSDPDVELVVRRPERNMALLRKPPASETSSESHTSIRQVQLLHPPIRAAARAHCEVPRRAAVRSVTAPPPLQLTNTNEIHVNLHPMTDSTSADEQVSNSAMSFNRNLGYRSGFMRSVPPELLMETVKVKTRRVKIDIVSANELAEDVERYESAEMQVCRSIYRSRQQLRRRKRVVAHENASLEPTDLADELQREGFVRNRQPLERVKQPRQDNTDATEPSNTSSTSSSVLSRVASAEDVTSSESDTAAVVITDEDRLRTFDEWQIHTSAKSCAVMLNVSRIMNLKLSESERYELEIYYRDVRKARGPVDATTGNVALEHYFSVPDDTFPVVFILVRRGWLSKTDLGVAHVRLDRDDVARTRGVTLQNTYFEKASARLPVVDPPSQMKRLGTLAVTWHADMRDDEGINFCLFCGRLQAAGIDGRPKFCLCDPHKQRLAREREQRDRDFRDRAILAAREARQNSHLDEERIPHECDYPAASDIEPTSKLAKAKFHHSCCNVM
jgi:hypothetical protein